MSEPEALPLSDDIRRKRILFRSEHRGNKEMDVVLSAFSRQYLAGFSVAELDEYEILLEENDADLWDWLVNRSDPPRRLQTDILRRLQCFELVARKKPDFQA